ncbi:hypothetical protein MGYG_03553 [Nannizzia gypsea CBS 118893]|uniref:Uncharacterized protein n=1 Tax=Arthroderma gypseum (strain ATCC MYA-4604 / CBS 118893) TaxID=535722 RepID=E4USN4_ARTGP|nr:hypothetical protein MGYG_03553 [Nannizzia gypsea CBS 118893]EFR00549.1 hypothetical protein MGYG_03553 [Nannizzia gypsea CBS 118893]
MSRNLRSPFGDEDAVSDSDTPVSPVLAARQRRASRHRRNRTSVTNEDLISFREKILGIPRSEQPAIPRSEPKEEDEDFSAINAAVAAFSMSVNQGSPNVANNTNTNNNNNNTSTAAAPSSSASVVSTSGLFTNLFDSNNNSNTVNASGNPAAMSAPRHSNSAPPSPAMINGTPAMPAMNASFPMNAGHQMDLNHLYAMVNELSEVLKNNRDLTSGIIKSAEDIARRAAAEGTTPNLQEVNGEITATRIAELERALAREKRRVETLRHEQVENMKLIAEYENAVGTMVEQIRNYCCNNEGHFLSQKRRYNDLLQAERDAHLASRLDRDYWHAQTMKCAEMIRTAYRLRCEEEELPLRIIAGLQNEVRAYRNALGMDPEKPEEEWGWEILKDAPPGVE